MCMRFTPLNHAEAQAVADAFNNRAPIHLKDSFPDLKDDVYPGRSAPLFVLKEDEKLAVQPAKWGFTLGDTRKLYFNTRLDTALQQYSTGEGMWSHAIKKGRCLVPARAFYERHQRDVYLDEKTGKPKQRLYRITYPGIKAFLMAGIIQDGLFSVVTTEPTEFMATIHNRMPLVLGPGESSIWLGPDFGTLGNREHIELSAKPEL